MAHKYKNNYVKKIIFKDLKCVFFFSTARTFSKNENFAITTIYFMTHSRRLITEMQLR